MARVLCLFLCVCATAYGFNVDIPSRVVHEGMKDSMFGFAVQAHIDGDQKMLLVGAPEADTHRVPGLQRPGAVFRCEPDVPRSCREMVFDPKGNGQDSFGREVEIKSKQWFGATLTSTGANGPIVACAPRYVSTVDNQRNPVGYCYLSQSSTTSDVKSFSPCKTGYDRLAEAKNGQRLTGMCQAGFSAAITKESLRLFMGAPGSYYWQGRTFSLDPMESISYFAKESDKGQLYSSSLDSPPSIISTKEAGSNHDDSYMGYSMAVGDFTGHHMQGVAVGMPRAANLRGMVLIYSWDLQSLVNLTGTQIGSYFGYSVATVDLDNDNMDDVIIGAPMYTRPKTDAYEHGRVYVVYQGVDRSFQKRTVLTGEVTKGRFGLSVASLRDINMDGFNDFAVGAPYGGPSSRGAVYIYHGGQDGVQEQYSQVITAEDVALPSLKTFGWSLSGGVDLDNNNYTDLVVGAYDSDNVVFFRSRPVVRVQAEVKFRGSSRVISLENARCEAPNGVRVPCAELTYCLTYSGLDVDTQYKFKVDVELDSKLKSNKRMFLVGGRQTSHTEHVLLTEGRQHCRDLRVYLDEDIRDKLTALEVKVSYELVLQATVYPPPPVLDATGGNFATDSLNIQKNCGPDNVCVPDLKLAVTTPTYNYRLGSGEVLQLDVSVSNEGEDAYEAAYYLLLPPGLTYSRMEMNEGEGRVYCSPIREDSGNYTLRCDLGNPMIARTEMSFRVFVEVESRAPQLTFHMEVNSTNPERGTDTDNTRDLNIAVVALAQLKIGSLSDPPELHYNSSIYTSENPKTDTEFGPQLIHKYNIQNLGPAPVDEGEIYIMWPYQTLNGDNLLYMLSQPEWVGPSEMKCDLVRHVNPEGLQIVGYSRALISEKQSMLATGLYKNLNILSAGDNYGQSASAQHAWSSFRGSQNAYGQGSQQSHGGSYSHSQGGSFSHAQEGSYAHAQGGSRVQGGSYAHAQGVASNSQRESHSREGSFAQRGQESYAHGGGYRAQGSRDSYGRGSAGAYEGHGNDFTQEERESIQRSIASAVGSQRGSVGQGGRHIYRVQNRTIEYDASGNVITDVESSTQYAARGHEGEYGSSFSNRYGATREQQQGQGQIGYSSRGADHLSWSTEESVNRDVMNAGSNSFRQHNTENTENDDLGGLGDFAAQSPNNQFKYSITDLGVAGSGSQGSRSSEAGGQWSGHSGAARGQQAGQWSEQGGYSSARGQQAGYGGARSSESSYSYSSSSQSGSQSSYSHRQDTRRRRQAEVDPTLAERFDKCLEKYRCEAVRCVTGPMAKGQEAWIALRMRVNASVLNELLQQNSQVELSTLAMARVLRVSGASGGGGGGGAAAWRGREERTVLTRQLEAPAAGSVPLWAVVLAALAGALLLILLIYLLYKCGFFKRNRPSSAAERQPLNGRDEHL